MNTSLDLFSPQSHSLTKPVARELIRSQRKMERVVVLHSLAAKEVGETFCWAAYLGITRLERLEQQALAADRAGRMSRKKWDEFHRRIQNYRATLVSLAEEAGWAIKGILAR
jgi:hypothetical protein